MQQAQLTVGVRFMNNLTNSCSLIINCETSPTDVNSLAQSYGTSYNSYQTGVFLSGLYAQTWKDALPDSATSGRYRKLIVAE